MASVWLRMQHKARARKEEARCMAVAQQAAASMGSSLCLCSISLSFPIQLPWWEVCCITRRGRTGRFSVLPFETCLVSGSGPLPSDTQNTLQGPALKQQRSRVLFSLTLPALLTEDLALPFMLKILLHSFSKSMTFSALYKPSLFNTT